MPEETLPDAGGGQGQIDGDPAPQGQEWSIPSTRHAKQLASIYETTLRQVTESFAISLGHETVNVKHVDEAHSALARVGLGRFGFLGRPETETAAGGILLGLAAGANDILSCFLADGAFRGGATFAAIILLFAGGFSMCVHGWYRGRLPSPIGYRTPAERLFIDLPVGIWEYFFPPNRPGANSN